jgi:Fe-S-cluster-containing hydrogenase component 2
MVGIADNYGNPVLDQETHKPIMKATKCDLCVGQLGGPACQKACPTGALERVNFSDFNNLPDMVQKV